MKICIQGRWIGANEPAFIVAELSANHRHSYDLAVRHLKAAKQAGVDAVKIQTYTADTLTIDADNKYFRIKHRTLWDGQTLYQLYKKAYTPWEWQPKLKKIAKSLGLIFFSTPFDKSAVDFLEQMDMPAYKIASSEMTDLPLIKYIASKKKPVIMSTQIATKKEIWEAIDACRSQGNDNLALLKCTSGYPAPFEEMNLKIIPDMEKEFKTVVGLSDHSLGITAAITSIPLGTKIIEKHFILDRRLKGPDAQFSLEPKELALLVRSIREAEKALGKADYRLGPEATKSRFFARSLFVVKDMKKGDFFNEENVRSIRPSAGLKPVRIGEFLGRKAAKDIKRGTPLSRALLDRSSK